MGISGLLSLTKSIQKAVHIKEYSGKRVAVDGNVWLHRGAFGCAKELALGDSTTAYITYFMTQIDLLLHFNVEPIIVFDGSSLPIKNVTKVQRQQKQQEAYSKGMNYLRQGNSRAATEHFQKAVQITPQMIQNVIKALCEKKIKYIQAPFEADAQLTFLCKKGFVDAVITEDSDLLIFGCPTLLYKLSPYGEVIQVCQKDLNNLKEIDISTWDLDKFRHMCILSGCDYLPSLSGIGLKVAYKLLSQYKTIDKVLTHLRNSGQMKNHPNYEQTFEHAINAFKHQYVYHPFEKKCVRMIPPEKETALDYLGTVTVSGKSISTPTTTTATDSIKKTPKRKPSNVLKSITNNKRIKSKDGDHTKTHKKSIATEMTPNYLNNKENIPPWLLEYLDQQFSTATENTNNTDANKNNYHQASVAITQKDSKSHKSITISASSKINQDTILSKTSIITTSTGSLSKKMTTPHQIGRVDPCQDSTKKAFIALNSIFNSSER
ncbi:unnamed protein product [Cunninghamella echinulata]